MVELFWDVASPYTYLATTQVPALERRLGQKVMYRPTLVGGIYKITGNHMPAQIPAKARWMLQDLARWRDDYRVAMKLPGEVVFPLNSLLPMRVATAADRRGKGVEFCHAVMRAYWAEGHDVSDPAELAKVADAVGLPGPELVEAAGSQEVKDALRATTDEAAARGAFGVPTFFVGEQMFWGNDRLQHVERAAKG